MDNLFTKTLQEIPKTLSAWGGAVQNFLRPTQTTEEIEKERRQNILPSEIAKIKKAQAKEVGALFIPASDLTFYKNQERYIDPGGAAGALKKVGGRAVKQILKKSAQKAGTSGPFDGRKPIESFPDKSEWMSYNANVVGKGQGNSKVYQILKEAEKEWDTKIGAANTGKPVIKEIKIADIQHNEYGGTLDEVVAARQSNVAARNKAFEGKEIPPIEVVVNTDGSIHIVDGRNRLVRAHLEGKDTIKAIVRDSYNLKPSSPSIPKELEGLAAEARKYKSAEEFVEKGPYRFTDDIRTFRKEVANETLDDIRGEAPYFTPNGDGTITLYHKTTEEAAEAIESTGRLNEGSYFALSEDAADALASTNKKGTPTVIEVRVDPASISFSSEEAFAEYGLQRVGNKWQITDQKLKEVFELKDKTDLGGMSLTDFFNRVKGGTRTGDGRIEALGGLGMPAIPLLGNEQDESRGRIFKTPNQSLFINGGR